MKLNWKKLNQKTVILVAMTVLMVITGALSIWYTRNNADGPTTADNKGTLPSVSQGDTVAQGEGEEDGDAAAAGNFFADFRTERNTVRTQQIEYLDSIVNNTSSEASVVTQAQQEKIKITQSMEKEVTIEGLLKAQGFNDSIVTLHDGSVNVVVGMAQLNDSQVAQVLEIDMRESGEEPTNIKIIPAA